MLKKLYQQGLVLVKKTGFYFAASVIGSILNYVYHVLLTFYLVPAQYGQIQTLNSLSYYWIVLTGALRISTTELIASADKSQVLNTIFLTINRHLKLAAASVVLLVLGFWPVVRFLKIDPPVLYVFFAVELILMLFSLIFRSALRARLKFNLDGWVQIVSGVIKIGLFVVPAYLLAFDQGAEPLLTLSQGAKVGFQASLIIFFWLFLSTTYLPADSARKTEQGDAGAKRQADKLFVKSLSLNLVINLALTSLFNTDMLFVKRIFSETEAGTYAFASTLGKIIYFVSMMLITFVFPVVAKHKERPRKFRRYIWLGLILMVGFDGLMVLVYSWKPSWILQLLSSNFNSIPYLGTYALFITASVIFNYMVKMLLILHKKAAASLSTTIALLQIAAMISYHDDINQLLVGSIAVLGAGMAAAAPLLYRQICYDKTNR